MPCEVEIYLRKGTVYLPTMGKMDEGFTVASNQLPWSPPQTRKKSGRHCAQRSRAAIQSSRYCGVARYRRPYC